MPRLPSIDHPIMEGVFDAWGWCESDVVEWRLPRDARAIDVSPEAIAIEGDNPPELVFVAHGDASFLPRELARLHAKGYALGDEEALAPWAIDDATDLFYERRTRPRDVLWLAAPTLRALVWGLHDWVHFHNHGPFAEPAITELQCDLVALAWLRANRERIGLDDAHVRHVALALASLSAKRFAAEGKELPVSREELERAFASDYRSAILRVMNE